MKTLSALTRRLLVARIEEADAQNPDWFHRLSAEEQDAYLRAHPKSRQKRDAKMRMPTHVSPDAVHTGVTPDAPATGDPKAGSTGAPKRAAPARTADEDSFRPVTGNPKADETGDPKVNDGGGGGARAHLRPAPDDRAQWPAHIQALRLPPAWSGIQIAHDPGADLQAVGKDQKGRDQYVYSHAFAQSQAAAKFGRIRQMHGEIQGMTRQNDEAMRSEDPRLREHAQCMHLVMQMGLRPGSDENTGADVKAHGASTLEGHHVVTDDHGKTRLRFVGKKGVNLDLQVPDGETAHMLHDLARRAGHGAPLFPHVSDASLRDYAHTLGSGSYKTKDFRTLRGTTAAHARVQAMPVPTNEKEYKKAVRDVATHVSRILGNQPAVALAAYICPSAFAPWHDSNNKPETAEEQRPESKPARFPQVHYGTVGSNNPIAKVHDEDDDSDEMPKKLPKSVLQLLRLDPRTLFLE